MSVITYALLVSFCVAIYYIYQHRKQDALLSRILWCSSSDNQHVRKKTRLSEYVRELQAAHTPSAYRLASDLEWDFVEKLLSEYQSYIWGLFQSESLKSKKEYLQLTHEDFFVVSLGWFLRSHECDLYFADFKKYTQKEKIAYGNGACYDAVYALTIYGTTYQKLMLIVTSRLLAIERATPSDVNAIMRAIDSREIRISRYN